MKRITIDFDIVKNYFSLLERYGVPAVELRVFQSNGPILQKKLMTNSEGLKQLENFVVNNSLDCQTINCTFNKFPLTHLSNKEALSDAMVEEVKFLFIDIDPVKEIKKMSATDQEVSRTKSVFEQVTNFLKKQGLTEQIHLFSGNGYHILLPIETIDVDDAKRLNKELLHLLDKKFSNHQSKIDTSVFNPARLGKLIGCVSSKGQNTEQRPYRTSTILKEPSGVTFNSIEKIKNIVGEVNKKPRLSITKSQESNKPVKANVEKWLDHYSLEYDTKPGDTEGFTIYIFKECPLKIHTNNQNGSCLIVNPKSEIQFKCLHDSHQSLNIHNFMNAFPLPVEYNLTVITEEKLMDKESFRIGKFQLLLEGLFLCDEEQRIKICSAIFIKKTFMKEDTHIMSYEICYQNHGVWQTETIPAELLQTNKLKGFVSSHGIEMLTRFESDVCDFLVKQKSYINPTIFHEKVGFSWKNDQLRYLLTESILAEGDTQSTTYLDGNHYYDLDMKGYDEWKIEIAKLLGRGPIEYALSIGLVPFVIGFLSYQRIKPMTITNLVLNFKGKSSTGKTTMARLIASIYGNPQSLQLTMNATSNALMKLASMSNGIAFIADETGAMQSSMNLDQLLFSLSSGRERLRLSKDITMTKPEVFSTGIILTSEYSMSDFLSETTGLTMRYLEFQDIDWTRNSAESDKINELVSNHYGGLIREVAQYVLNNQADVVKLFDRCIDTLSNLIKEDHPLKKRLLTNLSLIILSSHLLELVFEGQINKNFIENELVKTYELMLGIAENPKDTVYEKVVESILINSHRFVHDASLLTSSKSCIGRVKIHRGELIVNVFKQTFEKMLRDIGIKDIKGALTELCDLNLLHTNPDRKTKRLTVKSQVIPTYEIVLPLESKSYFNLSDSQFGSSNELLNDFRITRIKKESNFNLDDELL